MADTDLVTIATTDIAGFLRGRAMPLRRYRAAPEAGIGWTPTNAFITCFGTIADGPYGALGDMRVRPDEDAAVNVERPEWGIAERFVIGDVIDPRDGAAWPLCPRGHLKRALSRLEAEHGLRLVATFEQEFLYEGAEANAGLGFTLEAHRRLGSFPDRLSAVLDDAGIQPDNILAEYGPGQVEVSVAPKPALRAADEGAIVRELVRAVARGLGTRATFVPIADPASVGNGVHVHFALADRDGRPVNMDPSRPHAISERAGAFLAGILEHLPAAIALTAPSVVSYLRMTPHRWSAAFTNLGLQDREAALRTCPGHGADEGREARFHFEFRGADAAASPHLVLAALVFAGLDGLARGLPTPEPTAEDLSLLSTEALAARGLARLPETLDAALSQLERSAAMRTAFGDFFVDGYVAHKRAESAVVADLSPEAAAARYAEVY